MKKSTSAVKKLKIKESFTILHAKFGIVNILKQFELTN